MNKLKHHMGVIEIFTHDCSLCFEKHTTNFILKYGIDTYLLLVVNNK